MEKIHAMGKLERHGGSRTCADSRFLGCEQIVQIHWSHDTEQCDARFFFCEWASALEFEGHR